MKKRDSMVIYILSIITLGIYPGFYMFQVLNNLDKELNQKRNYLNLTYPLIFTVTIVLLIMTFFGGFNFSTLSIIMGFVSFILGIIFFYQAEKKLVRLYSNNGLEKSITIQKPLVNYIIYNCTFFIFFIFTYMYFFADQVEDKFFGFFVSLIYFSFIFLFAIACLFGLVTMFFLIYQPFYKLQEEINNFIDAKLALEKRIKEKKLINFNVTKIDEIGPLPLKN